MTPPAREGVLLVDKPAGMTSHDVVAIARRALGERRIGHAGTLDPFATGLLVLLVGRATRLLPYVTGEPKVYEATIRFGRETTTDDLEGDEVRIADLPEDAAVDDAIPQLTGTILQRPPAFSAKQVGGVRAHAAARRGEALELAPVPVRVHAWTILARRRADLDVRITCGGGTYIRALARDLGRATGSAAHLARLRRTRSGAFDVADAVSTERLATVGGTLLPPIAAVPELPTRLLGNGDIVRIVHGQALPAPDGAGRLALVDDAGALVAIAEHRDGALHPCMVLRAG